MNIHNVWVKQLVEFSPKSHDIAASLGVADTGASDDEAKIDFRISNKRRPNKVIQQRTI